MYHQPVQKNPDFGVILKTDLEGLKEAFPPLMVPGCKCREGLAHARDTIPPSHVCGLADGI